MGLCMIKLFYKNIKNTAHHIFLIAVLVFLALLVGWWSIFIKASIDQAHQHEITNVEQKGQLLAIELGKGDWSPETGMYLKDDRFEIVANPGPNSLQPNWPQYSIQTSQMHLDSISRQKEKQTYMVFGEGSVLAVCVLICCLMLYQNIRLEKRSKTELNEFWNRVTHELKTPITGIRLFLETFKRGTLSVEEQEYLVDMALKQVERQQQLTQNILMGQQLDKKTRQIRNEPMDLKIFLKNYINSHSLQLTRIKTELLAEESPAGFMVQADPNSVHTILDNLVDNAIKYGPTDLSLVFSIQVDKKVSLTVTDNGPGFAPEMAEYLFDAFRRLTSELPEGKHGTGMGLHICRSLAKAMGGGITASSPGPGGGAAFTLTLKRHVKK